MKKGATNVEKLTNNRIKVTSDNSNTERDWVLTDWPRKFTLKPKSDCKIYGKQTVTVPPMVQ